MKRLVVLTIVLSLLPLPLLASTLTWVNRSAAAARHLTLRGDGTRLVIVDDDSHAIVAAAVAPERVIVRGAAGAHDDTLTIDLANRLSIPGGIVFDGGSGGWDTLVVSGGLIARERVTQLSPHDGIFDLDGLRLRYTNLEPTTDTAAAASLTIDGTAGADTVTIADGPGAGQATISSPTFESFTFANKTNVIFDGHGGGDSVTINNPATPAGLSSFIIQNVATVSQSAPFAYPLFGVSATGTINLPNAGNNVTNIELVTQNGDVTYRDVDGATIGGVSASLTGVHAQTSGNISFVTSGVLTLADTNGADIVSTGSGNVFMQSFGVGSDIAVTVNNDAITAPAGSITLVSGGDILIGTAGAGFDNDVRAARSLFLTAGRDIVIDGFSHVAANDFGGFIVSTAKATAGRNFLLSDAHGGDANFGASGPGIADASVDASSGMVSITANNSSALFSGRSGVEVKTNRFFLDTGSGITGGEVFFDSASVPIDIGSTTDAAAALELSDAEIDRIPVETIHIHAAAGMGITVTQPITTSSVLDFLTDGTYSRSGTGSLDAAKLYFSDLGAVGRIWTITPSSITIGPGATIPWSGATVLNAIGGSGSDTFLVTPSTTTTITVLGHLPDRPVTPGDTLNVDLTGTTSPYLSYDPFDSSGYNGAYTFGNRKSVGFTGIETLNAATDLAVTKTDGSTTATAGGTVTWTIVASNNGPLGIAGTSIVDVLPPAVTSVSWTCAAAGGATCTISTAPPGFMDANANLPLGGTATFTGTATIDPSATGSFTNTVSIAPPQGTADPNASNDSASDTDTIAVAADVSVSKSTTQASYAPGGTITYTIEVSNAGPGPANDVTMTDSLPAGTTFASLTVPGGFTCTTPASGANGTISCNAATLAAGEHPKFTLVVNVSADSTDPIANRARVTSTSNDPNSANGSSTAALAMVSEIPALSGWMLMLLAAALSVIALMLMRR